MSGTDEKERRRQAEDAAQRRIYAITDGWARRIGYRRALLRLIDRVDRVFDLSGNTKAIDDWKLTRDMLTPLLRR
ncbi:MAG: hypothetical protein ABIG44_06650 [Planctomycetota bacterium]